MRDNCTRTLASDYERGTLFYGLPLVLHRKNPFMNKKYSSFHYFLNGDVGEVQNLLSHNL